MFTIWVNTWVIKSSVTNDVIVYWFDKVSLWYSTRGGLMAIKMIKLIRLHTTRYLCGEPLLEINHIGVSILKDGLPRALGPLLPILRNGASVSDLRLINTLLQVSRLIPAVSSPDYSTIEKPYEGSISDKLKEDISYVIQSMPNLRLHEPIWDKCHLSTKSGPNSQAMVGSIIDLHHLPDELILNLGKLGGSALAERLNLLKSNIPLQVWLERFKIKDKSLIRKLSIINDKEGKSRIIAILDYWSQTALKPLHDTLMKVLRKMPGDCTYDQQNSQRFLKGPGPYYSLDLTAATDRFPVELQEFVLSQLFSEEYARAWRHILVAYEFKVPYEDRAIKYGAGQCMGAYSSWATFALTHHLVIRVAAKRAGLPVHWANYCLLGDDVVLTNSRVVDHYKSIMSELGVDISLSKSHTSNNMYEFAKRWYKDGIEISGFPLGTFLESTKKWYTLAECLTEGLSRWSLSPLEVESRAIRKLLHKLDLRLRDQDKMLTFWCLPRSTDTSEVINEKTNRFFIRHLPLVFSCNQTVHTKRKFILGMCIEIKAAMIKSNLVSLTKQLSGFNVKVNELYQLGIGGQPVVHAIPYVEVVTDTIGTLQTQLNALYKAYENFDEEIIFGGITIRGIDPVRIESSRASRMTLLTTISFSNKVRSWTIDYQNTRNHHLSSNDSE